MRYLTVEVKPNKGGAFHPLGDKLTEAPDIERRAIHHVELLVDETVLLLAEASGSQERYEQIMAESPHVIDYLVAGDDRWMAVSQFVPTDEVRKALVLQQELFLVVDTPIRFTSEGHLEITYLGTENSLSKLFDYADELDSMAFDIRNMGEYEADESSLSRMITTRQEEVLEAAVEVGYYTEPRKASLEEVGDAVGISPGTVGEHLRKVEERVFSEIVR